LIADNQDRVAEDYSEGFPAFASALARARVMAEFHSATVLILNTAHRALSDAIDGLVPATVTPPPNLKNDVDAAFAAAMALGPSSTTATIIAAQGLINAVRPRVNALPFTDPYRATALSLLDEAQARINNMLPLIVANEVTRARAQLENAQTHSDNNIFNAGSVIAIALRSFNEAMAAIDLLPATHPQRPVLLTDLNASHEALAERLVYVVEWYGTGGTRNPSNPAAFNFDGRAMDPSFDWNRYPMRGEIAILNTLIEEATIIVDALNRNVERRAFQVRLDVYRDLLRLLEVTRVAWGAANRVNLEHNRLQGAPIVSGADRIAISQMAREAQDRIVEITFLPGSTWAGIFGASQEFMRARMNEIIRFWR
jgi:hypothetical protein